ncbi:hypothetical protein MMC30_001459 [Trapelia coarctata]|nr:hypothetical protein [Trapelia coarctata]
MSFQQPPTPNPTTPITPQDLQKITCRFWRLNRCRSTAAECMYAHHETSAPAAAAAAAAAPSPAPAQPRTSQNTKTLTCIHWRQHRCRHANEADCSYAHRETGRPVIQVRPEVDDPMEGIIYTGLAPNLGPRANQRRQHDVAMRLLDPPQGPRLVGGGPVERNRAEPRGHGGGGLRGRGSEDGQMGSGGRGRGNDGRVRENEGRERGNGGRGRGSDGRGRGSEGRERANERREERAEQRRNERRRERDLERLWTGKRM